MELINKALLKQEDATEVIISMYNDYYYLDYSNWFPKSSELQDKLCNITLNNKSIYDNIGPPGSQYETTSLNVDTSKPKYSQ